MEPAIFYILAAVTVIATLFAIAEKHAVHAIVYLVTSFFALSVIFFMLGAPVVAVFEVIIYAGAIMVLFLFVIMMLDLGHPERARLPGGRDWWPALVLGAVTLAAALTLFVSRGPAASAAGKAIGVKEFALALFGKYGVAVEVISLQLLFALVGALYLGKRRNDRGEGGRRLGEGQSLLREERHP
ncbi:NADH-quinone oxidoreductase subunit J [Geobacter sp.]|uniref:NADH-quinone oxidoreductase subunit J family protein n=1 Tax=Geobacter sp. TaxID=46610 RepID=UPI00261D9E39|nr:NADH-quinone oxidoreductase subunit J [Geobacter sp.]